MNMNKDIETCGWGQFVAIEECSDVPTKKQRPPALYKKKHVNTLESIDEYTVLLNSPHFCKKVYYYLNQTELVKNNVRSNNSN